MTGEPQSTSIPSPKPADLRRILEKRFSLEELRTLCQDLGVDYESLPGEGKEARARELVADCERKERIPDLVAAINQARPELPLSGERLFRGLHGVAIRDLVGLVAALLFGLVLGVGFALYLVAQYRQPSVLIDPLVSRAASATLMAQPTAAPLPSVMMKNHDTGQPIYLVQDHYTLRPGQRVDIQVVPRRESIKYEWKFMPEALTLPILTEEDRATITVPEMQDALMVVTVRELGERGLSAWEKTIIIRVTADERR